MTESTEEQQNKMSFKDVQLLSSEIIRSTDRFNGRSSDGNMLLQDVPFHYHFRKKESAQEYMEEWLTICEEFKDKMYQLSERVIRDYLGTSQE